jgi:ERO1-like protein beta
MCGNRACAVNTLDNEEDIPVIWRTDELGKLEGPKAQHPERPQLQKERPLMGELGTDVGETCIVEYDDEERDYCVPDDESSTSKGDYVSLLDNPERFTGYSGPSAHQVWEAIYSQNCFTRDSSSSSSDSAAAAQAASDLRSVLATDPSSDASLKLNLDSTCLEKRTFYRVISGMHASISTHLCYDYLNQTTGEWGPNLACYTERLHAYPDRISNLYFNYALVLRAVAKVRKQLSTYVFCSGDPGQDRSTKEKVLALADAIASGPKIYDESLMFKDPSIVGLKDDFRNRFRNVSRTMDCVGCDKCRLWGKLQTSGYGTALKILFEFNENDTANNPQLRRTELVALVNTLDKLSHSLSAIGGVERMLHGEEQGREAVGSGTMPGEVEDKDDGFADRAEVAYDGDNSAMGEFKLIWRTTKWVIGRWMELPRNL